MTEAKANKLIIILIAILAISYYIIIHLIQKQQLDNALRYANAAFEDRNKCAKNLGELLKSGQVVLTIK